MMRATQPHRLNTLNKWFTVVALSLMLATCSTRPAPPSSCIGAMLPRGCACGGDMPGGRDCIMRGGSMPGGAPMEEKACCMACCCMARDMGLMAPVGDM